MANKIVRSIKDIKDIEDQPLWTNDQNDLLSDDKDVFVRNGDEYHNLTKPIIIDGGEPSPENEYDSRYIWAQWLSGKPSKLVIYSNGDTNKTMDLVYKNLTINGMYDLKSKLTSYTLTLTDSIFTPQAPVNLIDKKNKAVLFSVNLTQGSLDELNETAPSYIVGNIVGGQTVNERILMNADNIKLLSQSMVSIASNTADNKAMILLNKSAINELSTRVDTIITEVGDITELETRVTNNTQGLIETNNRIDNLPSSKKFFTAFAYWDNSIPEPRINVWANGDTTKTHILKYDKTTINGVYNSARDSTRYDLLFKSGVFTSNTLVTIENIQTKQIEYMYVINQSNVDELRPSSPEYIKGNIVNGKTINQRIAELQTGQISIKQHYPKRADGVSNAKDYQLTTSIYPTKVVIEGDFTVGTTTAGSGTAKTRMIDIHELDIPLNFGVAQLWTSLVPTFKTTRVGEGANQPKGVFTKDPSSQYTYLEFDPSVKFVSGDRYRVLLEYPLITTTNREGGLERVMVI